jgi:hypothetical protein
MNSDKETIHNLDSEIRNNEYKLKEVSYWVLGWQWLIGKFEHRKKGGWHVFGL